MIHICVMRKSFRWCSSIIWFLPDSIWVCSIPLYFEIAGSLLFCCFAFLPIYFDGQTFPQLSTWISIPILTHCTVIEFPSGVGAEWQGWHKSKHDLNCPKSSLTFSIIHPIHPTQTQPHHHHRHNFLHLPIIITTSALSRLYRTHTHTCTYVHTSS